MQPARKEPRKPHPFQLEKEFHPKKLPNLRGTHSNEEAGVATMHPLSSNNKQEHILQTLDKSMHLLCMPSVPNHRAYPCQRHDLTEAEQAHNVRPTTNQTVPLARTDTCARLSVTNTQPYGTDESKHKPEYDDTQREQHTLHTWYQMEFQNRGQPHKHA